MNRPAPYADNHLFEEIASWKARAEAAEAKLAGFDSPTAESVPPAVVEAMARATLEAMERAQPGFGVWADLPEDNRDNLRLIAQAALSAALATGSVVICTPALRELLDAVERGVRGQSLHAKAMGNDVAAAILQYAFEIARAHQEGKG